MISSRKYCGPHSILDVIFVFYKISKNVVTAFLGCCHSSFGFYTYWKVAVVISVMYNTFLEKGISILAYYSSFNFLWQLLVGMGRACPGHHWWILITWLLSRQEPASLLAYSHQLLQGHKADYGLEEEQWLLCLLLCRPS